MATITLTLNATQAAPFGATSCFGTKQPEPESSASALTGSRWTMRKKSPRSPRPKES